MRTDTFMEAVFEAEVMRDVKPKYGEENPCTIFYEASDKVGGDQMTSVAAPWEFTTLEAKIAALKYLEKLANQAYASLCDLKDADGIWLEYGAIDAELKVEAGETGCHIDLNHAQYAMFCRLRQVERTVRELLEKQNA